MKCRKLALLMAVITTVSLFSACGKKEGAGNTTNPQSQNAAETSLPVATPNPNITHPEGQYYASDGDLYAEGGLAALSNDYIKIMIAGEAVEFSLSDNAKREVSIYNKDQNNLRLLQGTVLQLLYTEQDGKKIVQNIYIVEAN